MEKLNLKVLMWGDIAQSKEIAVKNEGVFSNLENILISDLAYKMPRLDQLKGFYRSEANQNDRMRSYLDRSNIDKAYFL